jgi:hypothetical protein
MMQHQGDELSDFDLINIERRFVFLGDAPIPLAGLRITNEPPSG